MGTADRILFVLLAALVVLLPFELRVFPCLSNLQWLFVAVSIVAVPILIRDRKRLVQNRLVLAAMVFVLTQWLASLLAAEFAFNAIEGAVRVTAGFILLCATLRVRDRGPLMRLWSVSAVLAAVYALLDYNGFGAPYLFRETEFYVGTVARLSGSFEYPNTAAAFFAISLPVVWTATKNLWLRIPAVLLVWIAVIMTYSRGAMIAVFLVLAIWVMASRTRTAFYFGGLAVGTFVVLITLRPSVLQRFREQQPAAEYRPEFNLLRRRPDELNDLVIVVKNVGTSAWPTSKDKPLTLSYWWNDPVQKKPLKVSAIYTPIPVLVRPQESVAIRASFRTPHEPGLYLLTWDMSQSGNGWFSGYGVFPGLVEVNVEAGTETSSHGDMSRWYRPEISRLLVADVPLSRKDLWGAALGMALQHPILGVGPDNFRLLYGRRFNLPRWNTKLRSNNLYLELLSGSGLAGLTAFGIMIAAARRRAPGPALALGIFLIYSSVDVFLMTTPIYFAFWILLGQGDENQAPADGSR